MTEASFTTLGDVSVDVRYGYTASATLRDSGVKFLRTTDIAEKPINWESVPYCEISQQDSEKYALLEGDLVVARMGTIGLSACVFPPSQAVFASYLIRFRIDQQHADPRYVGYVLNSRFFGDFIDAYGGGSVQPNINAEVLKTFEFPLPSLKIQRDVDPALGRTGR